MKKISLYLLILQCYIVCVRVEKILMQNQTVEKMMAEKNKR